MEGWTSIKKAFFDLALIIQNCGRDGKKSKGMICQFWKIEILGHI